VLIVTERAKRELARTLIVSRGGNDSEVGWRLSYGALGEFEFTLDLENEGDYVVEHQGARVLLVSAETWRSLEGVTLDYMETAKGLQLVMFRE
jgi:Fe-S cluster assembly iron-binding protein IscA